MTEEEGRRWLEERFATSAIDLIETFIGLVVTENEQQNLIAPSTIEHIWVRHVVDSAQLVTLVPAQGLWLDIGTGGGFPGFIVALITDRPVHLVEPRRGRAAFLQKCVDQLGLAAQTTVHAAMVERLQIPATVISARAVANVGNLLRSAAGCATPDTRWVLPRGRKINEDIAFLETRWRGMFHMEQSVTDSRSSVLVIENGMPR